MFIRCKNVDDRSKVVWALKDKLEKSRFTADVFEMYHPRHKEVIRIENVRLRVAKPYCGAHPGPCQVNGRRHMKSRYLEGADWIGWNDMCNDVMDKLRVSAEFWSYNRESPGGGKYPMRIGTKRRIRYDEECSFSFGRMFVHWSAQVDAIDFEDHCGKKAPRSEFPEGTPGLADWRPGREAVEHVH